MTPLRNGFVAYGSPPELSRTLRNDFVALIWLNRAANHGKYGGATSLPWVYRPTGSEPPKPTPYDLRSPEAIAC